MFSIATFAQGGQLTQTIRGKVVDRASGAPLSYVAVGVSNLAEMGTSTDDNGRFMLTNVPIGRHTIKAVLMGYESTIIQEVLVTSAKE